MSLLLLLSGGQTYATITTDLEGLLDSASRVVASAPATTDPVGVRDAVDFPWWTAALGTRQSGLSRVVLGFESSRVQSATLTDLISLLDLASVPAGQTFTDQLGLLDSAARVAAYAASQTDPEGLLDSATSVAASARAATDPEGLLDSAAGVTVAARAATDPEGLLDTAAGTLDAPRVQTDPEGLLDSAARVLAAAQTVTDPVGLLDEAAAVADLIRRPGDLLDLVDTAAVEVSYAVEVTDPLGLLDDAGPSFEWAVETSDSLGLVDDVTADYGLGLEVTDPLGLTDDTDFPWWTAVLGTARSGLSRIVLGFAADTSTAADPVGITDTVATSVPSPQRTITDAIALHDPRDVPRFTAVLGSEASLLGWIILGLPNPVDDLIDKLGLTDSVISVTPTVERTVTDPVALHDPTDAPRFTAVLGSDASLLSWMVLGYGAVPPQAPIDRVELADSLEVAAGQDATAGDDPLGLTDSVEVLEAQAYEAEATDPLGMADSLESASDQALDLADPLRLVDSVAVVLNQIELTVADVLGLVDDLAVFSHTGVTLPGHVVLSDRPAAGLAVTISGSDGLAVTVSRGPDLTLALAADGLSLSDAPDDDLVVSLSP